MAILPDTVTSQEKLAGALAYLFFPIPMMMNTKTEFTMFHAKQSFALICVGLVAMIVGFVIPPIGWLVQFIVFVVACWSAYQSYIGNKFVILGIAEYANMAIAKLGIAKFFQI